MPDRLAQILRELRESTGESLRDIERETKISNAYISQLERGEAKRPSADKLYTLANHYKIPYQNLLAAAGYIDEGDKTGANASVADNAFMAYDLSEDEKALMLKFLKAIRE